MRSSSRISAQRLNRSIIESLERRQLLSTIVGAVYHDLNGNGVRDAGEPGLTGRTVLADYDNSGAQNDAEPQAITDANGNYTLTNVNGGSFDLKLIGVNDFDPTAPPNGVQRVTVVAGQTTNATAFGTRQRNPRQYLDPTFGSTGETLVNSNGLQMVKGIKQLADGRYVVVSMRNGLPFVQRFTSSGNLDGTFGGGTGGVTPNLPAGFNVVAVDIAADGRLVLGGGGSTPGDFEVAVLTTAGTPDPTFSGDGFHFVDFSGGMDTLRDIAVTPDGRIVLLGTGEAGEIQLARLSFNGSLDPNFAGNGRVALDLDQFADDPVALAVQSDNSLIVAATRTLLDLRTVGLLLRVAPTGLTDFTYGSGGTRVIDVASGALKVTDVAVQSDNRAVIAGELPLGLMFFSRLNSTGTSDLSFGDNGRTTVLGQVDGFPLMGASPRLTVNGSSNIAFVTTYSPALGQPAGTRIGVGIFNQLGQLDTRYLRGGLLIQSFTGSAGDDVAGDALVMADNRIVVAGTAAASVVGGNKLGLFRTGAVQPRAMISGTVFNDLNANGVRDPGEGGAAGRTVYVDLNSNGERNTGEPFTVTDAQGNYAIGDILALTYPLAISVPAGFQQTYPFAGAIGLNLFPGQNLAGQNFGIHMIPPVITANAGGPYTVQEGNSVQLIGTSEGPVTAYEWDFDFNGITFTVDSTQQNPLLSAANLDGPANLTVALRVRSGASLVSEIAVASLTVTNAPPTATFTNSGPAFTGQSATVRFTEATDVSPADRAAGFRYSYDFGNDGTFEIVNSTSATANVPANLLAEPGNVQILGRVIDKDGGFTAYVTTLVVNPAPPASAIIRGVVFLDNNRNGVRDAGEPGVSGRTIYLDNNNNSTLDAGEQTTTTGDGGSYEFTSLPAGTYKIRQVLPAGFIQTTPANNFGNNATLADGQIADGRNFGTAPVVQQGGVIRGVVFNDLNRDGVRNSNEPGVPGRTVYSDANNNGIMDTNEQRTTTNSDGVYELAGLPAGTYKIRQILPAGFSQTTPANNFGNNVTLSTNQVRDGVNFGSVANAVTGSISGFCFNDTNGNGVQDSGETRASGKTVYIDLNNNGVLNSGEPQTTTNAQGVYTFGNLAAGTYRIRRVMPDGYRLSVPLGGVHVVNLAAGQNADGFNFGSTQRVLISGIVYRDNNNNGQQNTGEPGLSGWRVYIDSNNNGVFDSGERNVFTGGEGQWSFGDLLAGTIRVRLQPMNGFAFTQPSNGLLTLNLGNGGSATGRLFGVRAIA